jgi:hypothetical protein
MPSWPPLKNAALTFYVGLISQANTKISQVNPTLAAGDVKVAVDDAAPANLATLPVVDADFTKRVKVALSAAEMNGDRITVIFADAAGAEWCDLVIDLPTSVRQIDDLATPTNITAGTITTATNLTNLPAITANWLTAAGIAAAALNGKGDWNIGKTGYALSAAGVQAIWDALTSALTAAGSIGKKLADWVIGTTQTGDSFARLGAPAGASVSADIAAVKVDTAAILVDTGTDGVVVAAGSKTGYSMAAGGIGAGAHAAAELNAIADATLDRNMATGTDSGTDSTAVRTPRQALRVLRNKVTIAAGTLTARKEDDVTAAFTAAVATTAGNPISEVDPT